MVFRLCFFILFSTYGLILHAGTLSNNTDIELTSFSYVRYNAEKITPYDLKECDFTAVSDTFKLEQDYSYWLRAEFNNNTENEYYSLATDIEARGLSIHQPFKNSIGFSLILRCI